MPTRQETSRGVIPAPEDSIAEMKRDKNNAYRERGQVVAALAHLFKSGTQKTNIPGWDQTWHHCVYIDLPTGQVSWHYHDSQADLFSDLPQYQGEWDGHSTIEKYRRLRALRGYGHVTQFDKLEVVYEDAPAPPTPQPDKPVGGGRRTISETKTLWVIIIGGTVLYSIVSALWHHLGSGQ